jgi:hypothetical protein
MDSSLTPRNSSTAKAARRTFELTAGTTATYVWLAISIVASLFGLLFARGAILVSCEHAAARLPGSG